MLVLTCHRPLCNEASMQEIELQLEQIWLTFRWLETVVKEALPTHIQVCTMLAYQIVL